MKAAISKVKEEGKEYNIKAFEEDETITTFLKNITFLEESKLNPFLTQFKSKLQNMVARTTNIINLIMDNNYMAHEMSQKILE